MPLVMLRINAWSSPRNISTALMYSFAQRSDTQVVDEPLYAHYLSYVEERAQHPATEAVLRAQCQDGEQVVREVLLGDYQRPVVFFKQMTHHLSGLSEGFLNQMDHILLIRDPRAIISSYAKVVKHPSLSDIGIEQQYHLAQKLLKLGRLRAVVEASALLKKPRAILQQLCSCLNLPFEEAMLSWNAGPRKEDGVWAPYWYHQVHRSTGFLPYTPKAYALNASQEQLAAACQPYYQVLLKLSLQA